MSSVVLLDNDIVLKACSYAIEDHLLGLPGPDGTLAVLGVAEFVLRKRVQKSNRMSNPQRVAAALEAFLSIMAKLEPSEDEVALAARFEAYAQEVGVALDTGESLLLAAVTRRSARALITGDKRAIEATDRVATDLCIHNEIDGRLVCLEQVLEVVLGAMPPTQLASQICSEAQVDAAVAICFQCTTGKFTEESAREGLSSYIRHLRERSGGVLRGDGLSGGVL